MCVSLGLTECDKMMILKDLLIFKIAKDKCKKANTNNICDLSGSSS